MNAKIGKNSKPRGYFTRWSFRNEQRLLWRHECKLKKEIPRLVAELLRGEILPGKPHEIIEHDVRMLCKLKQIKFNKRLVQRALLIWLAQEMQDRVRNCLTGERNSAMVPAHEGTIITDKRSLGLGQGLEER